jgi:hypothetical protein
VSDIVYSRAPDVVWRLGPDRVLVRFLRSSGSGRSNDLVGLMALVWLVLDEPGAVVDLCERLARAGTVNDLSERGLQCIVNRLSDEGLIERAELT